MNTSIDDNDVDFSKLQSNYFGDAELFTQFERQYQSQGAENKALKQKCDELQEALARSEDERRQLQHKIVVEISRREQLVSNAEMEMVKLAKDREAENYNFKVEAQKNRQVVESVSREVQLLHEQLVNVQSQKTEAVKLATDLKRQIDADSREKRAVETYLKGQQDSVRILKSRVNALFEAKKLLEGLVQSQKLQLTDFHSTIVWLDKQCKTQADKISRLEKELAQKNECYAQEAAKVDDHKKALDSTDKFINQLKFENLNLLESLNTLNDNIKTELTGTTEELQALCCDLDKEISA